MVKELIIPNNRVNFLAGLSFLFMAFAVGNARASECEIVEFLKNKSQAVQLKKNSCPTNNRVSLGTGFVLAPGGRLWLKVDATENADFQLICQNRGEKSVEVKYYSPFLPWIKPEKVVQCDAWINNKLRCSDQKGVKSTFICAIAIIKRPQFLQLTTLERTTSVKMRNMGPETNAPETRLDSKPENIQAVTKAIQSEVNLCRNLYEVNQTINSSWLLNISGQIEKLSFADGKFLGEEFLSCIESVVNGFVYPRFSSDVMFVTKF
jgi:hypothetical protein